MISGDSCLLDHLPTTFTPGEVSTYYAVRVPNLKPTHGMKRRGPCPIHRGKDNNFAVDFVAGLWFCHSQCMRGGDIPTLEQALTGADFRTALASVYAIVGRPVLEHTPFKRDDWRACQDDRRQADLERSEFACFKDAVIMLAEQALEELDPWEPERAIHIHLLKSLQEHGVGVYRWWCRYYPEGAAALVEAGSNHQWRLQRLLLAFVKRISTEGETRAE